MNAVSVGVSESLKARAIAPEMSPIVLEIAVEALRRIAQDNAAEVLPWIVPESAAEERPLTRAGCVEAMTRLVLTARESPTVKP